MLRAVRHLTALVPGLFALPEFALAALFLLTWFQPTLLHPHMVTALVLLILMEFVILHSSIILGVLLGSAKDPLIRKAGITVGAIYVAFAVVVALASRQFWIIPAFALLTMNRLAPLLNEEALESGPLTRLLLPWLGATLIYMGLSMAVHGLPMPQFGITDTTAVADAVGGTGTFFEAPQAAIAMGFFYYLFSGALDFALSHGFAQVDRKAREALPTERDAA